MDPPGETYTRRVCAVLLADVSGFSAFMGEDDERAARAVDALRKVVQAIVADTQGSVEPVAGDAFFATFDSVVAAVDAALKIQRSVAEQEFAGRRLRVRIGVHLGDVLLRQGSAFGDAINVGARLQALARPGTICISEGVYRQVRRRFDERFEDLGRQRLKNISDPVHAYLIVPEGLGKKRALRARRWLRRGVVPAAVALALLVVAAVMYTRQRPTPRPAHPILAVEPAFESPPPNVPAPEAVPEKVALGVMLFKPLGDDADTAWMREAIRDGLNTQLSELSQLKVYSKEFIDFLITRQGLSEIEAATKLGIKKMLSGSFVKVGDKVRIETHVVDVTTGVLEASASTVGRQQDFIELQTQMVMDVIARLNLPITESERKLLVARRNTDVEAMKLLLEAEGGAAPPRPPGPDSILRLLGPASALAEESPDAAKAEILAVLERYRQATEARDLEALGKVYLEFPPEQQAAQQRYFDNVKDLKVAIDNVDVAVVGDEAVVSYTRADHFADAKTGRPMQVSVRLTKILKHQDDGWKLAAGK